jgi:hypothetical protein
MQEGVPLKEHRNGCHDHTEAIVHALNSIHSPRFTEILNASGELVRSTFPVLKKRNSGKECTQTILVTMMTTDKRHCIGLQSREILKQFDFSSKKAMLWWTL